MKKTHRSIDRHLDGETYEMISLCKSVLPNVATADEEFKKEMDYWSKASDAHAEEEAEAEKASINEFEKRVSDTIESGAGDRTTALRWIMQAENMENEHDAGYICYCLNLPYSYEKEFEQFVKRVA